MFNSFKFIVVFCTAFSLISFGTIGFKYYSVYSLKEKKVELEYAKTHTQNLKTSLDYLENLNDKENTKISIHIIRNEYYKADTELYELYKDIDRLQNTIDVLTTKMQHCNFECEIRERAEDEMIMESIALNQMKQAISPRTFISFY
jgi:biopolymer transport protein ExbB/TolQ